MRYLLLTGLVLVAASAGWGPVNSQGSYETPVVFNAPITDWRAKNWGLYNTQAKSHINAPAAWTLQTNKRKPIVAVIDTGAELSHLALADNMSKYGFNFVNQNTTLTDFHGHGTHVSGIILAVSNFRALVVPLKYWTEQNTGTQSVKNTVDAINFAIDHGAKIINYSAGGPQFSEQEWIALKRANKLGILIVVAAGNEHQNIDIPFQRYFPASYNMPNMISVAATDIRNNLIPSSNWGGRGVDVAAPGENIFSTYPGSRYGYMSGTSQATAFVTGIAAMLLAENPGLRAKDIKAIIERSVQKQPGLVGRVRTGGRVDAYAAMKAAKSFTKASE